MCLLQNVGSFSIRQQLDKLAKRMNLFKNPWKCLCKLVNLHSVTIKKILYDSPVKEALSSVDYNAVTTFNAISTNAISALFFLHVLAGIPTLKRLRKSKYGNVLVLE